jgi:hypothetical protein
MAAAYGSGTKNKVCAAKNKVCSYIRQPSPDAAAEDPLETNFIFMFPLTPGLRSAQREKHIIFHDDRPFCPLRLARLLLKHKCKSMCSAITS